LEEDDPPVVLLPDCEPVAEPLCEPLCDPELFAVPVSFAVPELLDSSLLLSSVAVELGLALVREPLSLSPVWLVALSFTSDWRCDVVSLFEESAWRAMRKGATSLLKASTGLLNMDGHADVVAARSSTEETTAEGRIVASSVYVYTAESVEFPREGCVWVCGEVKCGSSYGTRGAQILESPC
jgi:hypothetical protein